MKTLILTPSIALGLGLAGSAVADVPMGEVTDTISTVEVVTHQKVTLVETSEFYQGDFLISEKESLKSLAQKDLYSGQGATEHPSVRFVTF